MLQMLEEAKGTSEEPIGVEEKEELRELRVMYNRLRDKASICHNKSDEKSLGSNDTPSDGIRSCPNYSDSDDEE
jgi:hypothetical protein